MLGVMAGAVVAAEHPRLLFPASREAEVRERIDSDPLAAAIQRAVIGRAGKVLKERTCEYRIPDGKRLLAESRMALHHVLHCGWAWRTTGDERFRERVIRELDAACALKDWNPKHFLDTAEMATAVAIGYDWLHPTLTAAQRTRYEDALLDKALRVVGRMHPGAAWWCGATNNWSQVCATGMALAAEAVRERDPAWCAAMVEDGHELIGKCTHFYQPHGAYPEGPGYWHYGTNYHILLLAARESLGQEAAVPGVFEASGDFMRHVVGPTGLSFNFADVGSGRAELSPAQTWIASRFRNAGQAAYVRAGIEAALAARSAGGLGGSGRFFPLHLLWLPGEAEAAILEPPVARFEGEQAMAFLRNHWTPDAAWLAIKGGTGAASHGHLDAGSFVYEAGGRRWFHDLGSDDYNMPGYFGRQRWEYLRLNNFSHNTLVIDGRLQGAPKTGCPVAPVRSEGGKHATEVDLGRAYRGQAAAVKRAVVFDAGEGSVRMTDTISRPAGGVRWAVATRATPEFKGRIMVLKEGGRKLIVTRHDDGGGHWEEYPLKPATARENPNAGYRMVGFTVPAAEELAIEVGWELAD